MRLIWTMEDATLITDDPLRCAVSMGPIGSAPEGTSTSSKRRFDDAIRHHAQVVRQRPIHC